MSESSKTSVVWKILPWLLLAAVLVAFIWVYIGQKTSQQSAWEPPRNEANSISLDRDKLSDKPEPVLSYHDAVAKASRSVVNIYTTQNIPQNPYMDDPILRRFYEFHGQNPQASQETNLGSGVIVSADGYIVTNAHVIAKADEIVVALNDGRKAVAKVVGTDPDSDLAVIKVDMQGLEPLAFREKPIEVGDVALAIGNPFGLG